MSKTARPVRRTSDRCASRRVRARAGLAAEHVGGYGPTSGDVSGGSVADGVARTGPTEVGPAGGTPATAREEGATGGAPAPFGLPVLAEVPRLASVLQQLTVADRAQLAAVAELADLLAGDEVERTTGVGLDHWLAAVGRSTRMDRRLLVRTCRLLHRLPTLDAAVRTGRVSFAQLRGLSMALRRSRRGLDEQVDRVLAATLDALDRMERPDPDVLVRRIGDAVDELDPDDLTERERDAGADRFLALQPRLDGTGGRITGELDAAGLALLDAATAPTVQQAVEAGGAGAARADLLLHRLAASAEGAPCVSDRGPADAESSEEAPVLDRSGSSWWGELPPPKLLLRLRFETLLDPAVPAELLTTLVGGRLKLTGHAARRLADERGALLRTVVVDEQGAVLGVGRATRQPAGWLTDVALAVHDTCTGPGCDRSAITGQLDHARPWWPTRPDQPPGQTDVGNLGPLCGATNREKEAVGWRVGQTTAGTRTWHHSRSGLTCTTVPATWRPDGDPRHHRREVVRHRRRPPGTDPPGLRGPGPDGGAPGADDDGLPF